MLLRSCQHALEWPPTRHDFRGIFQIARLGGSMSTSDGAARLPSDAQPTGVPGADDLAAGAYPDLQRIAQSLLNHERLDHTLSATALVHEAYLRIVDQEGVEWAGIGHFRAIATTMMGRILIDYARRRGKLKRGGDGGPEGESSRVEQEPLLMPEPDTAIFAVNHALERLRALDERQFTIVQLRIFGGLSAEQTARALGLSLRTVEREWAMAKAWLKREMKRGAAS
jgi:RNA polymerase sigma-70 factor, ECF subfamily